MYVVVDHVVGLDSSMLCRLVPTIAIGLHKIRSNSAYKI